MARLTFDDVHFAYAGEEVLRGLSVEIGPAERVAVLGPNGAGKSTLLRLASGFLVPSAGRVLLDDVDLRELPRRAAARRIGGVAAEESFGFPFRVRESVALGRLAWRASFGVEREEDRARVDAALEATALTSLAERLLPSLSSGERQRVALARCLAQDAQVLLLDEPTAHLDLGHQQRLLDLLSAHVTQGRRTALAVLHDVNLAAGWADRILLLVAGRLVADGSPHAVLTEAVLEAAFGAPVRVVRHPERDLPLVLPRSRA